MPIEIRELDPADPHTLATLLPVFQTAIAADTVHHPEPTQTFLHFLAGPRPGRYRRCVTAFDGGRPIGYGCMDHDLTINQDILFCDLWVLPERRADTTAPLLEAFKTYARDRGCARLVDWYSDGAAPDYETLFAAHGGRHVDTEHRSVSDLKTLDREQYAAWAAPSAKNAHYRIEHWIAPTPERLLPAAVQASEAMRDAPNGELQVELPPPDVERRRVREAALAADGIRKHCVAALAEDGRMAGFHEVFVVPGFAMGEVGNTGVPAAFRGQGLGLRLKAAMALRLLADEPQLDVVNTWNDADNGPMLRVNEALGYIKAEAWKTWQFDL